MTFIVTYRGADGAVREERVEAANRAECFSKCRAKGILPLGLEEGRPDGKSWRSDRETRRSDWKARRSVLAAVLVVIVLAGVGFWLWTTRSKVTMQVVDEKPKKTALPKEVKPAKAPKPVAEPEKKDYSNLDNITLRRLPESETNNLSDAQVKYWRMFHPYPPPDPNKQPKPKVGHYKIFQSRTDNDIAFLVATEPGTMVLGNRSVGPEFENRFLRSLKTPIVISDDDSEHDKELKRAVIDARAELKAAYDRGEDIGKIMDDARTEILKVARYKAQLEKETMKALSKPGATAEDAEDAIAAMNKMLEARGIAPMELNAMSRIAMKYQQMKSKTEETK